MGNSEAARGMWAAEPGHSPLQTARSPRSDSRPPDRRRPAAGFSLLETLIAGALLSIALLAHASTVLSDHRLNESVESRSVALESARHFVERMRADDDWEGLYGRLRYLSMVGAGCDPRVYYPDFSPPSTLGEVRVRVEVPSGLVAGAPALREDVESLAFGLPFDLNGDGVVDAASHDVDYRALPVIVRWRWTPAGEAQHEIAITTWLAEAQ